LVGDCGIPVSFTVCSLQELQQASRVSPSTCRDNDAGETFAVELKVTILQLGAIDGADITGILPVVATLGYILQVELLFHLCQRGPPFVTEKAILSLSGS